MNFTQHFLDETLGSSLPEPETQVMTSGDYLCVQTAEHPLHVYRRVTESETIHPSVAQMEHNGQTYKLAWIEDEQW
jgi:hypothetical protein